MDNISSKLKDMKSTLNKIKTEITTIQKVNMIINRIKAKQ